MTARLIALQLLAVALLVGGAFIALQQTIAHHLAEDNGTELENQRIVFTRWITDVHAHGGFRGDQRESELATLLASLNGLYVRILDRHGRPMLDTAQQAKVPLPPFPPAGAPPTEARNANGLHFTLLTAQLPPLEPDGPAVLQLAATIVDDDALLRHLRQRQTWIFAIVLLTSGVLTALLARAVFRPVTRLTHTVAEIQTSRLESQIARLDWPAELSELAGELDRMLARLHDSFHRLARYSADLSHELRTPINNLRGEAEITLSRPRSAEEYRRALESSLEECVRLARLIDTLLFVAKADHPANALVLRPLDAMDICRAVADFFEPLASEARITILVRGSGSISGDPDLIRRAVANLVDNAIKHTPAGGHIDVTVRANPDSWIEIEVRDNGSGILETELPYVFERFFRGQRGTSAPAPHGFGLGLSIVRSIMELHHGTAALASVPQAGTTATLRFPPVPRS